MNPIVLRILKSQLPSILRDVATAVGTFLAAHGIQTESVEEALSGGIAAVIGVLLSFIDAADGPGDIGKKVLEWTVGPRVQDVANSLARKLIVIATAWLAGTAPGLDWSRLLAGDVPSLIVAILAFFAQRILKTR
jgi:hypothetical protein